MIGNTNGLLKTKAKVVSFNQLVPDNKINYTATQNYPQITTDTTTLNHKYYIKGESTGATDTMLMVDGGGSDVTIATFTNNKIDTIFTATRTGATFYNYSVSGTSTFSKQNIIDLTAMGLDTLTLDQCKALFNADYYPYTTGTDMQLIYDNTNPIALCELPLRDRSGGSLLQGSCSQPFVLRNRLGRLHFQQDQNCKGSERKHTGCPCIRIERGNRNDRSACGRQRGGMTIQKALPQGRLFRMSTFR